MYARSIARLAPHVTVTLVCSALGLLLPACDCAGNTNPTGDAGDTGTPVGDTGPHDSGSDTGVHVDGGPDSGVHTDGGMCSNPETCNGTDDDCDGMIDENIVVNCGSDIGICRSGTRTCAGGTLGACTGGMMAAAAEVCGNGLDDNCDEMVDEGCTCTDGATQSCGSGVGTCVRGTQTCASSTWGACVGETTPVPELCDGFDNNCDGLVDEIFGGLGGSCDGPDADMCMEGTLSCSADHMSTTCSDTTSDNVEACNGLDDNCNGTIDEGCTCTNGATQMCGVNIGACTTGMQTCAAGVWGACVGGVGPSAEICNGADDNCDGMTDEGFTLGGMCDGPDADFCGEGMWVCDATTGGMACSDMTGDSLEICNAMDDNCDGNTDEGFNVGTACDGPDTDMCTEGTNMCNGAGGSTCSDMTGDSVETCDGVDNDCDGSIDEGNPGGGVICAGAMDVGTCVSRTVCMGGALVCRGTFVGPSGTAASPGTNVMPLDTITAAIANAVAIGGGADVCVCDLATAGPSTFTENVTMVEGTSVLGGFDCMTWTVTAGRTTTVQDVDADGLTFPAAITSVTALDHMSVVGFDSAAAGSTTSAVTVTDSSPTLSSDTVSAGRAPIAIGLRVVHAAAATSPTITGGTYSATGVAGGTAIGVSVEAASPHFNMAVIGGAPAGGAPVATTAYGVDCTDCAGTTFSGGSVSTGGATTTGYGLYGTGNLAGVTAMTTNFGGGQTSGVASTSYGVRLETCMGAPTFTTVIAGGGFPAGTGTIRTAFSSSGMGCAPVIDGGRYIGCEAGNNCFGIDAGNRSALVVRNVNPIPGSPNPFGIAGTSGVASDSAIGMRCQTGACASVTNSTINAGQLGRGPILGVGLSIDGASPSVDSSRITGPNGQSPVAPPMLVFYGVFLRNTASVLSNNVIHDGTESLRVFDMLYDMTPTIASSPGMPTVVNNTFDYTACATCGQRAGLVLFSNAATMPSGTFRNNIVHNLAATGVTNAVIEANVNSDPMVFENNALWDPTAAGGAVYFDEGMTPETTTLQMTALYGAAAANQIADCGVNGSFHIGGGSACLDTGTMMSCPPLDFEGTTRPQGPRCDIGCDEH